MKQPLQRRIEFTPAFDKRAPEPNKNYGIHGVELKFYLGNDFGWVQFVIYTNWQLPHINQEPGTISAVNSGVFEYWMKPMPADLGYHSPKPLYEGQTSTKNCHLLPGPCYYDGSALAAEALFDLLVAGGSDVVWKKLEELWQEHFEQ